MAAAVCVAPQNNPKHISRGISYRITAKCSQRRAAGRFVAYLARRESETYTFAVYCTGAHAMG
eukprot:3111327-Prymnesium_polylepis.3